MYIVLGGYLRILGGPSVQSCCTYVYLFPNLYLSEAEIANPDLFACICRTLIVLTSPAFMIRTSHPVGPHDWISPKNGNRAPIAGGGRGWHNMHRVCQIPVTAPPRVVCVVWSPPPPILFNIYTNDQPLHSETRNFIYADGLCVTAKHPSFKQTEDTIEDALGELTQYYRNNNMRANPDKTQVTAFHIRNKEAMRELDVTWNGTVLENTAHSKCLGVTLDRTLSYKKHIQNTKMKVANRNNLQKKLSTSKSEGPGALLLGGGICLSSM